MDLIKFTELTLHNANEAKNFLSFMLGYNFTDKEKSEEAILGLFYSFPADYRSDKKLFEPIIEKYFQKFLVSQNNIALYNDYITKDTSKALIMEKNPNWQWENKVLEYKNLNELLKAFEKIIYATNSETADQFLIDNSDSFKKFIATPKNKEKVIESCLKKNLFDFFLNRDYKSFIDFCAEHNLDRFVILDKMYGKESYAGLERFIRKYNLNSIDLKNFLDDVVAKPEILMKDNKFFKIISINEYGSSDILPYHFLKFIEHNENDKATLLYEYFPEQLIKALKSVAEDINYHISSSKMIMAPDTEVINQELLDSVVKSVSLHRQESNRCDYYITQEKVDRFIEYYNIIRHHERLDEIIPNKESTNKKMKL